MSLASEPAEASGRTKDIRQAATLLGLLLVAALACVASALLNDPDTQWHIAVGRLIWHTGQVPETDTFSHTFAGAPWIAKEWLSQLILFGAYRSAGWWGVATLTTIVIAASIGMLFAFLLGRLRWTAAIVVILAALSLAAPEFVARPHILVLPVLLAWMIQLVKARERTTTPPLWVAGLMVPWANLHASFPIGLLLAAFMAAEAVLASPAPEKRATGLRWTMFLVASGLAVCASPYGFRPMIVALALSQNTETTSYISEWQPLAPDAQGLIGIVSLVLCIAALQKEWRRNLVRTAAVALLGYMMVRYSRFTLLFGMTAPVLAADPIARAFRDMAPVRFRVPPTPVVGSALACTLVVMGMMRPEPNPDVTPTAALRFAEASGLTGRVYNDYDYGGFLIFNGVPTFIDGRSEQLFTGGFTSRLSAALTDPEDKAFATILDRQNVTWALVKRGSPDAMHLSRMEGWLELFTQGSTEVFARTPSPSTHAAS